MSKPCRTPLWSPGKLIKICFLDFHEKWIEAIEQYGSEWIRPINLGLNFLDSDSDQKADIRIGFQKGKGCYSALGRHAFGINDKDVPTMNFDPDLYPTEKANTNCLRRIVLHQFGHALGFDHTSECDTKFYHCSTICSLSACIEDSVMSNSECLTSYDIGMAKAVYPQPDLSLLEDEH